MIRTTLNKNLVSLRRPLIQALQVTKSPIKLSINPSIPNAPITLDE